MRPYTILLCTSLLAIGTFADSAAMPQVTASPTVATVNGERLSQLDLERYLGQVHDSAADGQRLDFDLDRLMFRMINDTLLGQEARALGLDREGAIMSQVEAYRDRLLTSALERDEIAERARPEAAEVRRVFEQQYRRLSLQVVSAYQLRDAEALAAELRAGADMAALARERSVDPYAPRGGKVDSVAASDLQPEIAELAASLAPGELGGPVRTDLGWSVIRLVAALPADPERFAGLETTLRQVVRLRKSQALRTELAETARKRHPLRVDRQLAASVEAERLPDARLMPRLADPAGVVARIATAGDQELTITAEDFRKALLARWSGVRNAEAALASAPMVLEKMVEERLLLAEAVARGYGQRPEIQAAVKALETSLLVRRYLEEVVAPGVEVSREEMEAYYRDHQQELNRPPRFHLGQITVTTRDQAEHVAGLLRAGTDLAWLARQHSIDRFKDQGGERGWIEPAEAGFDPRLWQAKAGDVLDPAGAPGNYVVLKVTARQERGTYGFDEVSGNVRSAVLSNKMRSAVEELMTTLRSRSEIEIDRQLLATVRLGGTVSETSDDSPGGHGH